MLKKCLTTLFIILMIYSGSMAALALWASKGSSPLSKEHSLFGHYPDVVLENSVLFFVGHILICGLAFLAGRLIETGWRETKS